VLEYTIIIVDGIIINIFIITIIIIIIITIIIIIFIIIIIIEMSIAVHMANTPKIIGTAAYAVPMAVV
jgi:hypothetical protein